MAKTTALPVETPPFRITKPGLYDLSMEDYHADRATPVWSLSSSGARLLVPKEQPPAALYHLKTHPEDDKKTKALDFGSAAHKWLLEGDSFLDAYHLLPEGHRGNTNAGKAEIADAELAGKIPVKHADMIHIRGMREALGRHSYALAAFEQEGRRESSLFWVDAKTGIWCRMRPDFLPAKGRIFADYKSSRSVTDEAIRRANGEYGYHMQASWYEDGIHALGLHPEPIMLLVFQETRPPYLIRTMTMDTAAAQVAEEDNELARRIFAGCLRTGVWPGYPEEIEETGIPAWEAAKAERRHAKLQAKAAIDYAAPPPDDEGDDA